MIASGIKNLNKLIVFIYKFFGFGLLLTIVGGMFFYLSTTLFFFFNERWVVPIILSPEHTKVSEAKIGYLQQVYQLRKLEAEKVSISKEMDYIIYASGLHDDFHSNYSNSLSSEIAQDKKRLSEINKLLEKYNEVSKNNEQRQSSYSTATTKNLDSQLKSRLIDKTQFLSGQYMLSQLKLSMLNNQERLAELSRKKVDLQMRILSYESMERSSDSQLESTSTPSRSLLDNHQLVNSMLEKAKLESRLEPLKLRYSSLDNLLSEFRNTIGNLEKSPYIRASEKPVTVAMVPYSNLNYVKVGEPILSCLLDFIICETIGRVKLILTGEVSMRHPLKSQELRGQMIELDLIDDSWGESRALMVGRAPLFF